MDVVAMGFYGVICACLSAGVPNGMSRAGRLGVGAIVGIGAAALLPFLRGTSGY